MVFTGMRDILWRKDEFCKTTAQVLTQYKGAHGVPLFGTMMHTARNSMMHTFLQHSAKVSMVCTVFFYDSVAIRPLKCNHNSVPSLALFVFV